MGAGDCLFMHGDPVLWLATQTHFQHIPGDGAPPLEQRRCPQQHQGVVSHFPELQVEGTTWASKQTKEESVIVVRSAGRITPVLKIATHTVNWYIHAVSGDQRANKAGQLNACNRHKQTNRRVRVKPEWLSFNPPPLLPWCPHWVHSLNDFFPSLFWIINRAGEKKNLRLMRLVFKSGIGEGVKEPLPALNFNVTRGWWELDLQHAGSRPPHPNCLSAPY